MKLERVTDSIPPLDGVLTFVEGDHAFRFDIGAPDDLALRVGLSGVTSLAVGTLQLEIGVETGIALFVWGLHPRTLWCPTTFTPPQSIPGAVRVADVELSSGVTIQLAKPGTWRTIFDRATGWVCIASPDRADDEVLVAIASDTIVGIRRGTLSSIWLHPFLE